MHPLQTVSPGMGGRNVGCGGSGDGTCACGYWTKLSLLGRGAHGSVYLARLEKTGDEVAIKQVLVDDRTERDFAGAMVEEIGLTRSLSHLHIVRYLGTHQCGNNLNILLEYCPRGSLRQMLQNDGALSEQQTSVYTRQILMGLRYLHENGIAHRDVKGANVLVSAEGTMKLADFGASKRLGHDSVISGLKSRRHTHTHPPSSPAPTRLPPGLEEGRCMEHGLYRRGDAHGPLALA
ncbi:hypothetical protein VYU27_009332 [Nannochloropsis oceanica]